MQGVGDYHEISYSVYGDPVGAPEPNLKNNIILQTLGLHLLFLYCVFLSPSDMFSQLLCLFISFQKQSEKSSEL